MKKIITIISLFSSVFTFGQCTNLYVKEHFSGDPICQLYPGASLEVCLDNKTVRGGSCDFYIIAVRNNYDGMSIDLALDNVYWASKYAELKINTKYKNFGFIIGNRSGAYSYSNESEMSSQREQGEIARENYKKALEKEKTESDQKITTQINLAISKKEYFKANELYKNLNQRNNNLLNEIKTNLTPLQNQIDIVYLKYITDFNLKKKEYSKNNKDFILKNKESISISSISLDGKEAYLESIKKTTNQSEKKNREEILETESYVYQNLKGQHYIAAVGVASNFYTGRYDSKNIDKLQLALKYDTLTKSYYSFLDFLHKDTIKVSGVIVNKNNYKVKKYSMPYPKQLKDLLNVAINQGSNKFVEENYPILTIPLDYFESIPFNSLKKSTNPGEGIKNDQYDELKKKFEVNNLSITKFTTDKKIILTKNFYNPSLVYLVKKLYPNSDTIIFTLGDYKLSLGALAIHIKGGNGYIDGFNSGNQVDLGSIIPLQKGVIEFKNNKLKVYEKNGNYKEIPVNVFDKSIVSLAKMNLETLELDSNFYGEEFQLTALTKITEQNPIWFAKVQLGNKDKAEYDYNDSVFLKLLPTDFEVSTNLENPRFYISRESNELYAATGSSNSYPILRYNEIILLNRDFLRNYIINMTKYFEYKKEGNINKANKSLLKADKYIEKFKTLYFNMKYFY